MLFTSIDFAVFLPIVFVVYWLLNKHLNIQNSFILIASYIFYGWWSWLFLLLIFFSSVVDFFAGVLLGKFQDRRTRLLLLCTSICVNIGFLGYFKYFNFFLDSFVQAFSFFGHQMDPVRLSIILPVGISFYTFQTLSYTIDVYRGKLEPTKDVISFFAFVSFFPQLVAGPIERAVNLLPQFYSKRKFNYQEATDGLRQMLAGFFKKMVIADNCAIYVNDVFSNYLTYSGSTLLIAVILFSFQIYCDFSGYSNIAIGTAKLFGFNLSKNFSFPYFSRDIAEFWRRWHISLTSWFKDYVYIPLGGSRFGKIKSIRNIFIVFFVSGLWHGAKITFIVWGILNFILFLPLVLRKTNRANTDRLKSYLVFFNVKEMTHILITFLLVSFTWIFFRAPSLPVAFNYIERLFSKSILAMPSRLSLNGAFVFCLLFFLLFEWCQKEKDHIFQFSSKMKKGFRWAFYYIVVFMVLIYSVGQQEFIYFKF